MPELTKEQIEIFKSEISKLDSDIRYYKENIEKYVKYNLFSFGALISVALLKMDVIFDLAMKNQDVMTTVNSGTVCYNSTIISIAILFAVLISTFCILMVISNLAQLNRLLTKQDYIKSKLEDYEPLTNIDLKLENKLVDKKGLFNTSFILIFHGPIHGEIFLLSRAFITVFSILNCFLIILVIAFHGISIISMKITLSQTDVLINNIFMWVLIAIQIYFLIVPAINPKCFDYGSIKINYWEKIWSKESKIDVLMIILSLAVLFTLKINHII